jgi:hypothetical protein
MIRRSEFLPAFTTGRSMALFVGILLGTTGTAFSGNVIMSIRPPQFKPPAAGITINQSFHVTLEATPPRGCLSIIQGQATILISRQILEDVRAATPEKWKTEEERMAFIRGSRAKALLQSLISSVDSFGCASAQIPLSEDSLYLVGELLQSGQVAVVDNETRRRLSHIVVNFNGLRIGPLAGMGHISYSFTGQSDPFLRLSWWVS